ncbi:MAG: riboflavin synthase [Candidatus Omnitrophica bacterium]|nr:riboflavin synthase [Candidatus Omnitrophota bacterium]
MFSGIVEKQGKLVHKKRQGRQIAFTFETEAWEKPLKRGESISVNGVCLTVSSMTAKNRFVVQAVPETLNSTTLDCLKMKERVNLERSLKWGERIGGHFVLGHVDGVGRILKKQVHGKSLTFQIEIPLAMKPHLVSKGSIAIDGISLTIQKISEKSAITIAVIPHTARTTTLGQKKVGDFVNLETDVIAKHLVRLVQTADAK